MELARNVTIGQYIPSESPVHALDARVKIFLVCLMMLVLFLLEWWVSYAAYLAVLIAVVFVARLPLRFVMRGIRSIIILALVTFTFNLLFTKGTALFPEYGLPITAEGLRTGLLMGARIILLVLVTSLLTLTTSPIALTDALENIFSPFRRIGFPAHEIAMMMTIALRFIPTLLEETEKIMKAQMARGVDFERGSIIARARALIPILVPLFVHAFKAAEDLAVAMEARCYRGGEGRTRLRQLRLEPRDSLYLLVTGIILVAIVYLDISHFCPGILRIFGNV
jgi:energy-coupling factor transport system permease protein